METEKKYFYDEARIKYCQLENFLEESILALCKKYCDENGDICRAKEALSDDTQPILVKMRSKDDIFKETLCVIENLHYGVPDLIYVSGHSYDKKEFSLGWHSMNITDKMLVLYWFKQYVEK